MSYIRVFILLSIFFLFTYTTCIAQQGQQYQLTYPTKETIKGLSNFAKVSDILYRGAQPQQEGFAALKKMGIKTIVNLRTYHSDKDKIRGLGFRYINIPSQAYNIDDKEVVKFIKVMENPENLPVFVHCQHGADRTGTMVAIYRVYFEKWPMQEAIKELPNFGFHNVWANIKKYLENFQGEKIAEKVKSADKITLEVVK